ncbi:hypothetical protein [Novosphingobium sp. KACC 22771]|uniref:hypothetical protein n=1 Tax=Novosphingobium sp. KACC 22771 TaxID=3025670 RepID=UPI002365D5FA|nr:hypothetical protein [Novosphingobium sp. KACC 22771]WDF71360.1 hypothetical protein PQ467_11090 [Novosphingobium sp. KACC 22771]
MLSKLGQAPDDGFGKICGSTLAGERKNCSKLTKVGSPPVAQGANCSNFGDLSKGKRIFHIKPEQYLNGAQVSAGRRHALRRVDMNGTAGGHL